GHDRAVPPRLQRGQGDPRGDPAQREGAAHVAADQARARHRRGPDAPDGGADDRGGPAGGRPRRCHRGIEVLRAMTIRALLPALLAVSLIACVEAEAQAPAPIRIGDLNSYKAMASNIIPYRKGMDLAAEEVNEAGGVLGRKLEIVSRDDGGNPGDAV